MSWRDEQAQKLTEAEKKRLAEEVEFFELKMKETTEELKTHRMGPRGDFLREVLHLAIVAHARAGVGGTRFDD